MILLPTRRRLERRRDMLYRHLDAILLKASVNEVESVMRLIHIINSKIKTYFIREGQHEPAEIFEEQDPFETESPTIIQIEEALREIEI